MSGKLIICGTPIGNLEDITLRALNILKEVDLVAAEDTRHTLKLLNFYGIRKPLVSYHQHNRFEKGRELINKMQAGESVALVTDAGMPCISDPGFELVRLCHEAGIAVSSAPGPTALITALVLSGLPTERFVFEGFLPRDKKERRSLIKKIEAEERTLILYEAPHRLHETLTELVPALNERKVCLVREITKKYEEIICLPSNELLERIQESPPKGEIVLVIEGATGAADEKQDFSCLSPVEHVALYMAQGMDKKEAIKQAARDRGTAKRDIYKEVNT